MNELVQELFVKKSIVVVVLFDVDDAIFLSDLAYRLRLIAATRWFKAFF